MKELTIQEKAQAYDEAIKYAHYLINERCKEGTDGSFHRADLQKMFPELKESEDNKDNKIREAIIDTLNRVDQRIIETNYGIKHKDAIAWVEKQGDKDKLIQELGEYKVKYTQEVLEKCMNNKDDERLRKTTIDFLKEFADKGYENAVECIDWLEKQGETSHQLEENSAAKGLDDELEAFLCKYEEVSAEEKARLIGVAEHFYLIGKNPNANL